MKQTHSAKNNSLVTLVLKDFWFCLDQIFAMVKRTRISPKVKAYARFLRTDWHQTVREVAKTCSISPASVVRINREPVRNIGTAHRVSNAGRKPKLKERQKRGLLRAVKHLRNINANFTVREVMAECHINESDVSVRTVQRFLNSKGYFYLQARKKGLLRQTDLKARLQFARKIKRQRNDQFWKENIMFYFDGVSFGHKTRPMDQARVPKGRIWRKTSEGLAFGCTAKGQKVGTQGKVVRIFAAISYGKGVVLARSYKKLSGAKFAKFVNRHFERVIRRCGPGKSNTFLQDGDPSQNSAAAKAVFSKLKLQVFTIPARSPDFNPIENVFKILNDNLRRDALKEEIYSETFQQFRRRVIRTLKAIPTATIDRIIDSMTRRVDRVIQLRGTRLKY